MHNFLRLVTNRNDLIFFWNGAHFVTLQVSIFGDIIMYDRSFEPMLNFKEIHIKRHSNIIIIDTVSVKFNYHLKKCTEMQKKICK